MAYSITPPRHTVLAPGKRRLQPRAGIVRLLRHGGTRDERLQRAGNVRKIAEADQIARAIKPIRLRTHGKVNIGDGVVVAHDPLPRREAPVEHAEQAL